MPLTLKDASGKDVEVLTSEEIAEMVTGATKRQIDTATKKLTADITKSTTDALTEALKPIQDKLAAPPEPPKPDDKQPDKPDPKVSALESKLADLDKKYADEKAAREKAELARRDDSARTQLIAALNGHVRPELIDMVARDFFATGKVTFDEQSRPLLTVTRKTGGVEEDVQVTFQDGAQMWAKANPVYAPPPSGGTQQLAKGTAPTRQTSLGQSGLPKYDQPATTDEEKARRANERAAAIDRRRAAGQI